MRGPALFPFFHDFLTPNLFFLELFFSPWQLIHLINLIITPSRFFLRVKHYKILVGITRLFSFKKIFFADIRGHFLSPKSNPNFQILFQCCNLFFHIDSWCLNDCYKTQLIHLHKIAYQFLSFREL